MDFETGKYRESTVGDLYNIARLVDRMDNIHWYHRSVVARDTETILDLDINTTYACLSGTSKSIAVSYTDSASVKAVLPMLDAVACDEGKFRKRPFCKAVCCHVVPPIRFATESCDPLEAVVEAGMPIDAASVNGKTRIGMAVAISGSQRHKKKSIDLTTFLGSRPM